MLIIPSLPVNWSTTRLTLQIRCFEQLLMARPHWPSTTTSNLGSKHLYFSLNVSHGREESLSALLLCLQFSLSLFVLTFSF